MRAIIPEIRIDKPWLRHQRIAGRGKLPSRQEFEREMRPFLVGVIIGAVAQLMYVTFKAGVLLPRLWR